MFLLRGDSERLLEHLTNKQRLVIRTKYLSGGRKTLSDVVVGEILGMKRCAVTRVKQRALERLRDPAMELAESHQTRDWHGRQAYVMEDTDRHWM